MAIFTFAHPNGIITFEELFAAVDAPPKLAWLHPLENAVNTRKRRFKYPGADGVHNMRLGKDDQLFLLMIVAIAATEQALEDLINPIREAQDDQSGDLKFRGTIIEHDFCILESGIFDRHEPIKGIGFYQEGTLTFRKLAPNVDTDQGWGG